MTRLVQSHLKPFPEDIAQTGTHIPDSNGYICNNTRLCNTYANVTVIMHY